MKKENKNTRIEIRISNSIKESLKQKTKEQNTTISKLLYNFIIHYLKEE